MQKTVTSCNDCPFARIVYKDGNERGSSCNLQPVEWEKDRPTLTSSSPDWCPLKKEPFTIGLAGIPDSEYKNRISELLKPHGFEYAYTGTWINDKDHNRIHICWSAYDVFITTFLSEDLPIEKLLNYLKENPELVKIKN